MGGTACSVTARAICSPSRLCSMLCLSLKAVRCLASIATLRTQGGFAKSWRLLATPTLWAERLPITALPGLGVRVWMIVQEEAELVRLYGPNTAQTIKSQSEVRQYFAVNNAGLAQSLSKEMGTRTVRTRSHNLGHAVTDEVGESIAEAGQPLMRPEEIMQLGPSDQLLMVSGLRPIFGQRIPFWHIDPWNGWADTNPVEGDTPQAETFVRLRYTLEDEE